MAERISKRGTGAGPGFNLANAACKENTVRTIRVWMFQRPNGHTHHDFHRYGTVSGFGHQLPCKLQPRSPQATNRPLTGRSTVCTWKSLSLGQLGPPAPPAWLRLRGRGLPAPALAAAGRGPAGSPLRGSAGLRRSGRAAWEGTAASPSAGAGNCECYQIYHGTMNVLLPSTRPPRLHYSLPPPLDARFQMTRQRRQADVCAGSGPGKDVVHSELRTF